MFNFLGIGSAFNTDMGNTSAYIKKGSSLLLIDCGSMVFSKLHKLKLLDVISDLCIVITHTHPDHVGSLGELIFYSHYVLNHRPKIIFPDKELIDTILNCTGVKKEFYEVVDSNETIIENKDLNIKITFFKASHVDTIPSYGVFFDTGRQRVYYSGDSNNINSFILDGLKEGRIDLLYQDTCGIDYEGNPHLYLGRLEKSIEPDLRHKVYCMHLDQRFDKGLAKKLGFNVVEVRDGLL